MHHSNFSAGGSRKGGLLSGRFSTLIAISDYSDFSEKEVVPC
jgi:hypothetical protein